MVSTGLLELSKTVMIQNTQAEFGLDVDEATRLRRLREARLAPMMGGGSALTTAKGITGLGAAE